MTKNFDNFDIEYQYNKLSVCPKINKFVPISVNFIATIYNEYK